MPPTVYQEMTFKKQPDGKMLEMGFKKGLYKIVPLPPEPPQISGLKGGEKEVLILFLSRGGTILTDDGRLASLCRREKIPYLNALTAAISLWQEHQIDYETLYKSLIKLIKLGRYSYWVIAYVEKLIGQSLKHPSHPQQPLLNR